MSDMSGLQDTLSIFAEVAIALAGFSGIVIAFGRRSLGSLSNLEKRRLSNLFFFSGLVLLFSLLGISLLHIDFSDERTIWISGSTVLAVVTAWWLLFDLRQIRRLDPVERRQINPYLIVPFNVAAVLGLGLQIANAVLIHKPWPVLLALVLAVAFAFQQFILLVRMGLRDA